jgi:hypothetical protein
MAGFIDSDAKRQAVKRAMNLLDLVRGFYSQGKLIQEALALYQAGTDPAFNAAVNAIHDATQRQQHGQMLATVNTIITDREDNHKEPLGL